MDFDEKVDKELNSVLYFGVKSLIGILTISVIVWTFFNINPFVQGARIVAKTMNADNVIYNYEWFKQQAEDVQAVKVKVKIAAETMNIFKKEAGERSKWIFEDKNESSRLRTILTGLKMREEQMIADYNARSKMAYRNIFKHNLPQRME